MSGDMSMGRVVGVARGRGPLTRAGASSRGSAAARSPSCVKIENVASMAWGGETLISTQFQLQLREAALELRDARAKRRDLGLALVVALGVFGLLASPALDEVELSLATAACVEFNQLVRLRRWRGAPEICFPRRPLRKLSCSNTMGARPARAGAAPLRGVDETLRKS